MRSKDIVPGRFYRVRVRRGDPELRRISRKVRPRYLGDLYIWEATSFQARGPTPTRHAARDILEEVTPDAKTSRIIALLLEDCALCGECNHYIPAGEGGADYHSVECSRWQREGQS